MAYDKVQLIIEALDKTKGAFNSLKQNLTGISGQIEGVQAAFRGLLASAPFLALASMIKKTADAGEEYLKVSKQMGVSVENLSTLKYAAEQSEASWEDLTIGLKFFSKALYGVNDEGKDTTFLLKKLGVTAKDPYQALLQVADAFSEMEDGSGKAAIAMALFGRGGLQMINMLNEGSEGIKKLQGEVKEFSTEAAKAGDKFNDNLNLMKRNIMDLVHSIGNELIPVLNELFDLMTNPKRGPFGTENRLKNLERDIKIYQEIISTGKDRLFGLAIPEKDIESMKKTLTRMLEERQKILDKYYTHTQKGKFAEDKKPAPFLPTEPKAEKEDPHIAEFRERFKRHQEKLDKEIKTEKEAIDEINKLTLSGYDYRRQKATEAFEERKRILGLTKEVQLAYALEMAKIDDEEIKHKDATLRQIRDLELQHQLAVIDLKEKTFQISEKEAVQKKIDIYNQYLESLNEDYKLTIGIKEKDEERLQILNKIAEIQGIIIDLKQKEEEQTRTLIEGLARGLKDIAKEFSNYKQLIYEFGKSIGQILQQSLSTYLFDITSGDYQKNNKEIRNQIQANVNEMEKLGQQFENGSINIDQYTSGMERLKKENDKLEQSFKTLKDYVRDFARSVLKAIDDIVAKIIASQILYYFASMFGTPATPTTPATPVTPPTYSGPTGYAHNGCYIPRFHPGGLADDEVPAILQKGEYVVSRHGVETLDRINSGEITQPNVNVAINIENQTGQPVNARQGSTRFDGKKFIIDVIMEKAQVSPEFKNMFVNRGY